jgi:sulfur carrier protein
MTIVVNGIEHEVAERLTVADLLVRLGVGEDAVAVEINRNVIPRERQQARTLEEGDRLEIVGFVGGG